ncbi:MAG: ferritin-like domain-containing protein [Candidatus Kariarchaeaceae archaeon]|jgi:rubrerythrin
MAEIKEIIDFAIKKETEAYNLYSGIAKSSNNPAVKKLLKEIANDELGHKKALEDLSKAEEILNFDIEKVQDLKLSDHLQATTIDDDSSLQETLVFAMKEEKGAYELYMRMAKAAETEKNESVFQKLAQMELIHKNKLESLYDDMFYADN